MVMFGGIGLLLMRLWKVVLLKDGCVSECDYEVWSMRWLVVL